MRSFRLIFCCLIFIAGVILVYYLLPSFQTAEQGQIYTPVDVTKYDSQQWEDRAFKLARANLVNDKYLILNLVSYGHLNFLLNWMLSMHRSGYYKYLIMCIDEDLFYFLRELNFDNVSTLTPTHWLQEGTIGSTVLWQSRAYNALLRSRLDIANIFLKRGFTVIVTDDDIVWMSPIIIDYLDYVTDGHDFSCMTDEHDAINSGFYLARPTTFTLNLFQEVKKKSKELQEYDQVAFNIVVKELQIEFSRHIFRLDTLLFPNGRVNFELNLNVKFKIYPLIMHANYCTDLLKKRQWLSSANAWYVGDCCANLADARKLFGYNGSVAAE